NAPSFHQLWGLRFNLDQRFAYPGISVLSRCLLDVPTPILEVGRLAAAYQPVLLASLVDLVAPMLSPAMDTLPCLHDHPCANDAFSIGLPSFAWLARPVDVPSNLRQQS